LQKKAERARNRQDLRAESHYCIEKKSILKEASKGAVSVDRSPIRFFDLILKNALRASGEPTVSLDFW
jgi:hypothetical protein